MTWRIWVMLIAIASSVSYLHGKSSQADADKLAQLEGFHELTIKANKLQKDFAESDKKLQEMQAAEANRKPVIKWRTQYLEKVSDPDVAKCIDDSGLREEYNASFPTADDTN